MHLSYRGVSYSSAVGLVPSHRPLSVNRFQATVQRAVTMPMQALAACTQSVFQVASASKNMHMAPLVNSSARVQAQATRAEFEARYHAVERQLQLAYAVGNRSHIAVLEAEVERLTGWRFHRPH